MGTKKKKVNFEVITCWMPFLTCSCWGHSAHMVKVDEIFKVTEIYKVTLAGHPAWFFFFLVVYRNRWEWDHTAYWLQRGNAVLLRQELLRDQNWTRNPQCSGKKMIEGGKRRKAETIIHWLGFFTTCSTTVVSLSSPLPQPQKKEKHL